MYQWGSWLRHRQEERLLAVRGARHLRLRRLGASLAAWCWWLQRQGEKRVALAKSEGHRRLGLMGWALGALIWYRDLRKAKAADRAEAKATYVARLQVKRESSSLCDGRHLSTCARGLPPSSSRQLH